MIRILKRIGATLASIIILIIIGLFILKSITDLPNPEPIDKGVTSLKRTESTDGIYRIGNNWFKQNSAGLYELYTEGPAFDRGVITGKLTREIIQEQEQYFIEQIEKIVPSKIYLRFLKFAISWFNRNLDNYVDPEYLDEIYGVSLSASDSYNYIANGYQRILNYHAAHDIGHALQSLHLVGCTSFSAWNDKSSDSTLIHGRNFDFYFGDNFAKNKIISFTNPDQGYRFMTITWGGMIGAVSGMNEKGLSVTINAAKSTIPRKAKTPITLLTRKILQYAKNIDEAYRLAGESEIFVSESIMIGSAEDNKTAIIEKTPENYALFLPDTNFIMCTNHFQSDSFQTDIMNQQNIQESSSYYRSLRLFELINQFDKISPDVMADILRDKEGLNDKEIGFGNEKAINQLIAHHSVIFKPAEKQVWISTNPYQLGEYIAYDLDEVFGEEFSANGNSIVFDTSLTILADTFVSTQQYQNYLHFREMRGEIGKIIRNNGKGDWPTNKSELFIDSNPDFYEVYSLLGDLFMERKDFLMAEKFYAMALEKEVVSVKEEMTIRDKLLKCKKKVNDG